MKEFLCALLATTFLCSVAVSLPSSQIGHKSHHSNKQLRQAPKPSKRRTRSINTGLSSTNLNINGIAVGFLPALSEPIQPNTPLDINNRIGAPMSIMGSYIQLYAKDTNLTEIDWQLPQYRQLIGWPVWEIAIMPVEGLEKVTPEIAGNIARKMQMLNAQGITVWLRFAHEMNGDWYVWGQKPALFLEKWKLVTNAVRSVAPKTLMLWAPNSGFGKDHDALLGGYTKYWPGGELVDMIGLSFYHYGGHERANVIPAPTEALDTINEFVKLFGSKTHDRPVVLAETAASYTRSLDGKPAPGTANERDIKLAWMSQLLSRSMAEAVPELKAIVWFEVMKNENAAGNTPVKSEDFRIVTGPLGQDAHKLLAHRSSKSSKVRKPKRLDDLRKKRKGMVY
ncbi:hypothetical protein PCANC_17652 [Puccinia coronata f. sp. avenae]|uniref:GH26 domain-containing protein n=1 Tax=Puccinia coronata f. sp. avenae TaxID=200324 RepID=A0A2N5SFR4_9BASI|nr:hypothetical protein PCANC_17652 [Puccinia coronata f. sp. avenae]PLW29635.1 hypothetical protein PCASD_16745 [Puccinia coronata f. sp. avenae]